MSRRALVTGVCGGIGAATAGRLAAAGYVVIGLDRRPEAAAPAGLDFYLEVDLRSVPAVAEAARRVAEAAPEGLAALVNNAAIQVAAPLAELTAETWDELMAVNLRAPFLLVRDLSGPLAQAAGAVVNVASVHAVATSASISAYAASKGGLTAWTRALAIELAPHGVRANAVLPGAVDTGMLEDGLSRGHLEAASLGERKEELARRTVAGRIGRPEEIAEAVLFLADGERSGFVTGACLVVDGGATVRLSTE